MKVALKRHLVGCFALAVLWTACRGTGDGRIVEEAEVEVAMEKVADPCACLRSGLTEGQKAFCREMKLEPSWLKTLSRCAEGNTRVRHIVHNMPLDGRYILDSKKSAIRWLGTKVGVEEKGTLPIRSGFIEVGERTMIGGQLIVEMNGLKVTSQKGVAARELGRHLRSEDFFDVANFPTATFTLKSSKPHHNGYLTLFGQMTIKGVTQEMEARLQFSSADPLEGGLFFEFDRTDFNVRYGSGSFFDDLGDDLISDQVSVAVAISEDVSGRK